MVVIQVVRVQVVEGVQLVPEWVVEGVQLVLVPALGAAQ